ncbi:thialysine N-epsilon-acetyltransferase-like [Battus philenor]|uniref:thialysine N-epsilon-acetyltransferase-like n=1 Tax=Battus philenor TaxID=42288 RepID=UPI0035D0CCD0
MATDACKQKAGAAAVLVRDARREDMPAIHRMIIDLATYEGMPDGPQLSVQDLESDGFDSSPPWFFVVVAECAGEIVGHAMCNRAYSSWTRRALYMEDLFVAEAWRRRGVARALLRGVCERARALGAERLDWHVLAHNEPARRLYARLGARDLCRTERRRALRLDRDRILAVADGHLLPEDAIDDDQLQS